MARHFTHVDYAIVVVYLFGVVLLGSWFARGQKGMKDYLLAGRNMVWWAVAMSIIATDLSAVSYLGAPGWVFEKDMQYALSVFMLPVGMVLVCILFVPLFYRLQIYTVYEYLGRRFNLAVRLLAAVLFVLVRAGWLATVISTPCVAVAHITGIPLWVCIVVLGVSTTFYTMLGGMKAVIWTDVVQFMVLVGGALAIATVLLVEFDGNLVEMWRIADEQGKTRMFDFSLDATLEMTVWGATFGTLFMVLTSYGCDQVVVQRYFTATSVRNSVKSVLTSGAMVLPVTLLLYFIGFELVAYYSRYPEMLEGLGQQKNVMPHFIAHGLPAGVSGLLIAGILAATMSSISSGIQSLTTSSIIDLWRPLAGWRGRDRDAISMAASRGLVVGWGVMATLGGLFVQRLGTFLEITGKINGLFQGPLGGVFMLAVLNPRANAWGALIGTAGGFGCTLYLSQFTEVSWVWWALSGGLVTLAVGSAASYLWAPPSPEQRRLTLPGSERPTSNE